MSFTKNQLFNVIGGIIVLIILIGILRLAFWEFNIFKKEAPLPEDILTIQSEVNYIKERKFEEIGQRLDQILPSVIKPVEIPEINPQEIGKGNLFE